jgi:hypothetical protein
MYLCHDHLMSSLSLHLSLTRPLVILLGSFQRKLSTQMTNMFRRIEPQESFQIRYPKTSKYHRNNHYRKIHPKRHQYNYHLGYSKHDNFDERAMTLEYFKCGFMTWISYLSGTTCLIIEELDLLR